MHGIDPESSRQQRERRLSRRLFSALGGRLLCIGPGPQTMRTDFNRPWLRCLEILGMQPALPDSDNRS